MALELNFDFPLKLDEVIEHLSVVPPWDAMDVVQTGQQEYTFRGDFARTPPTGSRCRRAWRTPAGRRSRRRCRSSRTARAKSRSTSATRRRRVITSRAASANTVPARTRGYREVTASLCRMFPNNIAVGLGELNDTIRSDDDDSWTTGRRRWAGAESTSRAACPNSSRRPSRWTGSRAPRIKGVYCLRLKAAKATGTTASS